MMQEDVFIKPKDRNLENNSYLRYSDLLAPKLAICDSDRSWHSDYSFLQEPFPFTMVYINHLPQATRAIYFIDMERVYREIPECFKNYLADKKALHEVQWRNKLFTNNHSKDFDIYPSTPETFSVARHPLIIVHPVTGAKILYPNSGCTTRIDGMDCLISQKVLSKLFSLVEIDKYIQPYILQEGDILLWSNRTLNYMNSLTGDLGNIFRDRVGISDGLPFYYSSIRKAIEKARDRQLTLNF